MEKIDWSKRVMDIFLEICKVPRPSGHEEKICEYLKNFAQSRGLGFRKDSVGNVLITPYRNPIPCKKLKQISIAQMFAETIRRVISNESISSQYLIK